MPSSNPIDRYFPFYVKDWLSDPDVRLLTPEQRGAYIDLLAYSWVSSTPCSLPADDTGLAQLAGLTPEKWAVLGPAIKRLLSPFPDRPDLLCSPKLLRVHGEASELHQTLSEAGKRGAEARERRRSGQPAQPESLIPPTGTQPHPAFAPATPPRELVPQERKEIRRLLHEARTAFKALDGPGSPGQGMLYDLMLQLGKRAFLEKGVATVQGLYAIVGETLDGGATVEAVRDGLRDYLTNAPPGINAMHFRKHIVPRKGEPKPGRTKPAAATNGVTFDSEE